MVVFGFIALYNTPWLISLENIYSGFPSEHLQDQYRYPLLKYYRYTALAFYTQALFTLLFIDEKMKDFKG
jgi:ceramide synthetase